MSKISLHSAIDDDIYGLKSNCLDVRAVDLNVLFWVEAACLAAFLIGSVFVSCKARDDIAPNSSKPMTALIFIKILLVSCVGFILFNCIPHELSRFDMDSVYDLRYLALNFVFFINMTT